VTWKLVEQQHESEHAFGRFFPGFQFTCDCLLIKLQESLTHRGVERVVFLKPAVAANFIEPKVQNIFGFDGHSHRVYARMVTE